jgi:leader peptidase (prepilin peptidase) / N-methyltransferase
MRRISCKTFDRARAFVLDGLNWRGAARPYALVVWGLFAGLAWVALDVWLEGSLSPIEVLLKLALLAILIIVAAIDARFGIIPDSLSIVLLVTGAVNLLLESVPAPGTVMASPAELPSLLSELNVIGWRATEALIAVLGAVLLRTCYRFLRSRDGFGLGDVKFVGAAVLWVGLPMLPLMLIVAVASALATIVLLRKQVGRLRGGDAIPFGPHLALGLWLAFLLAAPVSL